MTADFRAGLSDRPRRIPSSRLQLLFFSTVSPRDVGAGDDPRRLALALSRVDVTPLKK